MGPASFVPASPKIAVDIPQIEEDTLWIMMEVYRVAELNIKWEEKSVDSSRKTQPLSISSRVAFPASTSLTEAWLHALAGLQLAIRSHAGCPSRQNDPDSGSPLRQGLQAVPCR